jgi:hypothetical protein
MEYCTIELFTLCNDCTLRAPLRSLYYKTVNSCNLRIFVIARVFVSGKPFQTSLIFAGTAGANEAPFRCSTLG